MSFDSVATLTMGRKIREFDGGLGVWISSTVTLLLNGLSLAGDILLGK